MGKDHLANIDHYCPRNTWIHNMEVRTKILALIISVFLMTATRTEKGIILEFIFILSILRMSRFSYKDIISRGLKLLPFVILMGIPIVFTSFPLEKERIRLFILLAFKAINGMYFMTLLFTSQPMPELLNGLGNLGVPHVLMSIMLLAWRYVFIMGKRLRDMEMSLEARSFDPGLNKKTIDAMGGLIGGILIMALDTSDQVYEAMIARGFSGRLPLSKAEKISWLDLVKALGLIGFFLTILIVEGKWIYWQ